MAIWYEVENTEKEIATFLDCNLSFHDYRLEKAEYVPSKDMLEFFLMSDTGDEGVILRFVMVNGFYVYTHCDYEAEWMSGSVIINDEGYIMWVASDDWGDESQDHLTEFKKSNITWASARRLFWAVTDNNGTPIELPKDRIDQVWNSYGKIEQKHFEPKPFKENWDYVFRTSR
jgi:hypothetical protein